jgi:hypothetical protein
MNNKLNNPAPSEPSQEEPWDQRVDALRLVYIRKFAWSEKEIPHKIRPCWVALGDNRVPLVSRENSPPPGFLKAFEYIGLGWTTPYEIWDWLLRQLPVMKHSPKEVLCGLLNGYSEKPGDSPGHQNALRIANFFCQEALRACEEVEKLVEPDAVDAFWKAFLLVHHAGRRNMVIEIMEKPQLMADIARAQCFKGKGRSRRALSQAAVQARQELLDEQKFEPSANPNSARWPRGLAASGATSRGAGNLTPSRERHRSPTSSSTTC